jgi:hypothetical protein
LKSPGLVLGNGPSLALENFPEGMEKYVGVNRSYQIFPTDIWSTVDYKALPEMLAQGEYRPKWGYFRKTAFRGVQSIPFPCTVYDEFRGNSGFFGIEVAKSLNIDPIYLLGFDFDVKGHFYGTSDNPDHLREQEGQRKRSWKRLRKMASEFDGAIYKFDLTRGEWECIQNENNS